MTWERAAVTPHSNLPCLSGILPWPFGSDCATIETRQSEARYIDRLKQSLLESKAFVGRGGSDELSAVPATKRTTHPHQNVCTYLVMGDGTGWI